MLYLACNLLNNDAYSNDFVEIIQAKNSNSCNQIRSNQMEPSVNDPNHFQF